MIMLYPSSEPPPSLSSVCNQLLLSPRLRCCSGHGAAAGVMRSSSAGLSLVTTLHAALPSCKHTVIIIIVDIKQ